MIEVVVWRVESDGSLPEQLAKIKIENLGYRDPDDDRADYEVKFAVERGGAVGLHSRIITGFRRKRHNVLGLLRLALDTLDERELELEDGISSADLARRLNRTLPAL